MYRLYMLEKVRRGKEAIKEGRLINQEELPKKSAPSMVRRRENGF